MTNIEISSGCVAYLSGTSAQPILYEQKRRYIEETASEIEDYGINDMINRENAVGRAK